jgi:hypothetical protein
LTQTFLHSKLFPCIHTADHTFGKFDGSGVSGSTGRGRSQALESKVRFSFCRRTHYAPQFLRVCANCVIEYRRKNGGKTYWRRAHQLPLAASTMWLLHHITSSCLRHDASVGLFGLLNEASRQNWRTTLGTWRHLGKRGRRKWRTNPGLGGAFKSFGSRHRVGGTIIQFHNCGGE